MKRSPLVLLCVLAACAGQPKAPTSLNPPQPAGKPASPQERARIHTELAALYYSRGNHGVALQESMVAIEADPQYGPAYNVLGLVQMELKEDTAADRSFQQALAINPNDSEANNNYGWFLCNRGREKEAIAYFLAAVRNPLYQTPGLAYTNAGVCSLKLGQDNEAESYLLQALKLQPGQPRALQALAEVHYRRGDYSGAKQLVGRFLEVAQPTPEVLWLGVLSARQLGDRNAEASYGTQLRRRFPDSKEALTLKSGSYP
ncbi:MAG: type IV pilus biogenesis/stability protein PilW [Burkholderiales bacterium]|nr:type IV pilus biogenesis/stability protein PilW [Burkholderiales bacterium]